MGFLVGRAPLAASIEPHADGSAGRVEFEDDFQPEWKSHFHPAPKSYIRKRLLCEVAGTVAHDLLVPGRTRDQGDHFDLDLVKQMLTEGQLDAPVDDFLRDAKGLLEDQLPWLRAVANALVEKRDLDRAEMEALRP
ncbi:MAG: hypothetical protein P4M09_13435 [Devosia sp.]|nr:hypothetical protein [Devosia sp.]